MSKFYAITSNDQGQQKVLTLNSEIRSFAEIEANTIAKENGTQVIALHKVPNSNKQPSTMLKKFTSGDPTPRKRR